jgi:hypothetical protein
MILEQIAICRLRRKLPMEDIKNHMLDGRSRLLVSDHSLNSPWNRFGVTVNDDDMSSLLRVFFSVDLTKLVFARI